jgi:hypothetical protein
MQKGGAWSIDDDGGERGREDAEGGGDVDGDAAAGGARAHMNKSEEEMSRRVMR